MCTLKSQLLFQSEELLEIDAVHKKNPSLQLMVGFNRRFAPSTLEVIKHFELVKTPKVVNIRVNAGSIPADHWIQDPKEGGGRLIGEGCHFIDLASALLQQNPRDSLCNCHFAIS
ncbi:MAG: hypothetical protein U5L01_10235 [Rheinheimera sp.]|nr:hypothetical protein [Rheinheimera sp.]